MISEAETEVYRALRESQTKYTYFLLATAGAGIALAVNRTVGAALCPAQIPLGLAVICWGLSIWLGCRYIEYVNSTLFANGELLRVERGIHPMAGSHPKTVAVASEGIREAMESNQKAISRLGNWQFRLLLLGALLYVTWHVTEMYLRTGV